MTMITLGGLFVLLLCESARSWSLPPERSNTWTSTTRPSNNINSDDDVGDLGDRCDRRGFLLSGGVVLATATAATVTPSRSDAACLPGDAAPDCIGFYKVPWSDVGAYGDTPERLAMFAPDVRWVPPPVPPASYETARREMEALRVESGALREVVARGDLTAAGVALLRMTPRVSLAGGLLVRTLSAEPAARPSSSSSSSTTDLGLRAIRAEAAYAELLCSLNSCDVLLGQALRNELGSTIVAQLVILDELREANTSWDELHRAIPVDYRPTSTNEQGN